MVARRKPVATDEPTDVIGIDALELPETVVEEELPTDPEVDVKLDDAETEEVDLEAAEEPEVEEVEEVKPTKTFKQKAPKGHIVKLGEDRTKFPTVTKDNQRWPKENVYAEIQAIGSKRLSYVLVASKNVPLAPVK